MDQQRLFEQIIEAIYASATDAGARQRLLVKIAELFGSDCANLGVLRRGELVFGAWHGFPDYPVTFFKEAVAEDEWRRSLLEAKGSMPVGVHFGSRHIPHDKLMQTRFYNDYCRPCGVDYSVAACFLSEQDDLGVLAVYRGQEKGDYGSREGRLLGKLLPHLARATAFAARFQRAELLRSSGERAWDLMQWGFLLLDDGGQIVFANRTAEEILGQRNGLTTRHGRFVATASAEATRLLALLAAASASTSAPRAGGAMLVKRRGHQPLQLWVMPLPREEVRFPAIEPFATVCVLLVDPEREAAPPLEALKVLYGLTRAEAGLVAGLLQGERLEDYADRSRITLNTARSHLKSVFAKTDTRRQSALIRLLSSMPQPRQD
jgi:DNA-binding CsgD family transcriptional regulator/PAS domain-containing protein